MAGTDFRRAPAIIFYSLLATVYIIFSSVPTFTSVSGCSSIIVSTGDSDIYRGHASVVLHGGAFSTTWITLLSFTNRISIGNLISFIQTFTSFAGLTGKSIPEPGDIELRPDSPIRCPSFEVCTSTVAMFDPEAV